jgi:hypothetical protein
LDHEKEEIESYTKWLPSFINFIYVIVALFLCLAIILTLKLNVPDQVDLFKTFIKSNMASTIAALVVGFGISILTFYLTQEHIKKKADQEKREILFRYLIVITDELKNNISALCAYHDRLYSFTDFDHNFNLFYDGIIKNTLPDYCINVNDFSILGDIVKRYLNVYHWERIVKVMRTNNIPNTANRDITTCNKNINKVHDTCIHIRADIKKTCILYNTILEYISINSSIVVPLRLLQADLDARHDKNTDKTIYNHNYEIRRNIITDLPPFKDRPRYFVSDEAEPNNES